MTPDPNSVARRIPSGTPVIWTKPEDNDYDPNLPLPNLKPIYPSGVLVLKGDGSVVVVRKSVPESAWRAAIEPNGNPGIPLE